MKIRVHSWFLLLSLAHFSHAGEVRIAAAASLSEAITEIGTAYQTSHPETKITPVFAGSNALARQIESGAPIDLFFSADEKTMDGLVKSERIAKNSVVPVLSNALVVVVQQDSTLSLQSAEDLQKLRRLSIADPAAVPAGVYAKTWLTGRNLWEKIQPITVGAENVRGALAVVESGNADAAIVYRTDAAISHKVKIAFTVPAAESPAIVYPVALCKEAPNAVEAKPFVEFLQGEQATAIFRKRGFTAIPPATAKP
ncbi:MAG TPA: molybdate ABC transporter substrate-binding protein [Luteolibacter sp.]